jgi:hypothetical protein
MLELARGSCDRRISIPCGFTGLQPRLPIGLQLLGKPFGEETILRLAAAYEQSTAWRKEKPPLSTTAGKNLLRP